jgi:hypothetical protein
MDDPRARRTLVKSPPELWAEVSDAAALAGHLGEFGEIRITRLEPETTVAWEGDRARGTVELEPAGWGTRVTLTARIAEPATAQPAPGAMADPEPAGEAAPAADPAPEPEAAPERDAAEPGPAPEPGAVVEALPRRRWWWPFGRRRSVAAALAVETLAVEAPAAVAPAAEVDPVAASAPVATEPAPDPEPAPEAGPPEAQGEPIDAGRAEAILSGVLDDLGAAHHRPFSRG